MFTSYQNSPSLSPELSLLPSLSPELSLLPLRNRHPQGTTFGTTFGALGTPFLEGTEISSSGVRSSDMFSLFSRRIPLESPIPQEHIPQEQTPAQPNKLTYPQTYQRRQLPESDNHAYMQTYGRSRLPQPDEIERLISRVRQLEDANMKLEGEKNAIQYVSPSICNMALTLPDTGKHMHCSYRAFLDHTVHRTTNHSHLFRNAKA